MPKFPVYAPIKNFKCDQGYIVKEVLHQCKPYFHEAGALKKRLELYNPKFNVCTEEQLEECSYQYFKNNRRFTHYGKYNPWEVVNLTWIPGVEDSKWQNVTTIDGKHYVLRDYCRDEWPWRPEFENSIPAIKEMVSQFPFEYLQAVRLITMRPPGIGMQHKDSYNNKTYFDDGFAEISVNILNGGGSLRFEATDESVHDISPMSCAAYHFDDSVLHGVTETDSFRVQFRIMGKMNSDTYMGLLDLSNAIW